MTAQDDWAYFRDHLDRCYRSRPALPAGVDDLRAHVRSAA
jgi:hypothetical protein